MACLACREPLQKGWQSRILSEDTASPRLMLPFNTMLPGLYHECVVFGAAQVQMVLEWTSAVGVNLLAGKPGPHGLTALHVAAVMENGAKLAALLTGAPSAPPSCFLGRSLQVLFQLNASHLRCPSSRS